MWGNAFADLAKKAHDLQEQAKEQASHMSTPTFFNLDAMQQQDGEEQVHVEKAAKEMFVTPQPSDHYSTKKHNNDETTSSTTSKKPTVVKKLDMDSQDASLLWDSFGDDDDGFGVQSTAAIKQPADKKSAAGISADPFTSTVESDDGGGWNDDDLLELTASNEDNGGAIQEAQPNEKPTFAQPETTVADQITTNIFSNVLPVMEATDDKDAEAEEPLVSKESLAPSPILESSVLNGGNANKLQQDQSDAPLEEDEEEVVLDEMEHTVPLETTDVFSSAFHSNEQQQQQHVDSDEQNAASIPVDDEEKGDEMDIAEKVDDHLMNGDNMEDEDESSHDVDTSPSVEDDKPSVDPSNEQTLTTTGGFEIGTAESDSFDETDNVVTPADYEEEEEYLESHDTASHKDTSLTDQATVSEETKDDTVAMEMQETLQTVTENMDSEEPVTERAEVSHVVADAANESAMPPEPAEASQGLVGETCNDEAAVTQAKIAPDEQVVEELESATTKAIPSAATSSPPVQVAANLPSGVSQQDHKLELQQLRNDHQEEIARLSQQHENQLQELLNSFNHDSCEQQRQEMEQRFMDQIRGKEEQLQELMRENEGYQLKIDVLKREVTGTQELLEQRDSAIGSSNASHSKNVELLEQRIKEMNDVASRSKAEGERVKDELKSTKAELETSNEAYATLKARVKVVATELKERRVECRSLSMSVNELKQTNEQLETQIVNLQSQIADRDRTQTEKDKDVKQLRERIETLELQLHKTEGELKGRDAVGEKALSTYKKKAQNALAVANARAAAANQAKEEAELEAATARTMSEEAIARAKVAEDAGNAALAEAREYVREMETEKMVIEKELLETQDALESTSAETEQLKNELDASRVAQDKLAEDVKELTHGREEERSRNHDLQQELDENQRRLELLYEEVETLREDLRQANNTIAASSSGDANDKESRPISTWTHHTRTSDEIPDRSDAEGTIAMLEGELRDANRAIKELKDALKNAIAEQGSNGYGNSSMPHQPQGHSALNGQAGNESTPLFFAMEKQAELNTARDEINRLANLLGDAESSKMEAYEAMEEMRRRMEEAEARLNRQEKFEGTVKPPPTNSNTTHDADGNANLEYLKNIMMSYLNAKTLAEKKALVPVIAAVLCLTPEEQAAALKNLDDSTGIEGVGMALFESFGSIRR